MKPVWQRGLQGPCSRSELTNLKAVLVDLKRNDSLTLLVLYPTAARPPLALVSRLNTFFSLKLVVCFCCVFFFFLPILLNEILGQKSQAHCSLNAEGELLPLCRHVLWILWGVLLLCVLYWYVEMNMLWKILPVFSGRYLELEWRASYCWCFTTLSLGSVIFFLIYVPLPFLIPEGISLVENVFGSIFIQKCVSVQRCEYLIFHN